MTRAEQTEAIRQSMQDEKATKDEVVRELVSARAEIERLRALQKCGCDPGEACRALGNAWDEVERLKKEADGQFVEAAIRVMQANPGFNARDYAQDGITADDFEMFFTEDMNEAWRCHEREKARAEAKAGLVCELVDALKAIRILNEMPADASTKLNIADFCNTALRKAGAL